jgi:hypothetical protein
MVFCFCSAFGYSQTWTERNDELKCDYEYTVITKEQYQRLLSQYEVSNDYCLIQFNDILEMENSNRIISGTKPRLRGYYYLLAKMKPLTQYSKDNLVLLNVSNGLVYGNSNTGAMSLVFMGSLGLFVPGVIAVDSNGYAEKYNQFLRFVNGN